MSPAPEPSIGERLGRRLDDYGRRFPRLALLALILLACAATVLLLAKTEGPVVLYQRF